jgi:phosphomannomutase
MNFEETLTGFKWMGSRSGQLLKEGKTVLFAFEEAIGYMCGTRVLDKDGVTAAGVMAEMAAWLHAKRKRTLVEQLKHIYSTYGSHISYNSYVLSRDSSKTHQMFERIRNGGEYCKTVAGVKVLSIRDLGTGLDTSRPDNKALLPVGTSSPMITFQLENCVTLTIRSSGTEPKIKWYSEIVSDDANARGILVEMVNKAVQELIQPNHFGFERRKFNA